MKIAINNSTKNGQNAGMFRVLRDIFLKPMKPLPKRTNKQSQFLPPPYPIQAVRHLLSNQLAINTAVL